MAMGRNIWVISKIIFKYIHNNNNNNNNNKNNNNPVALFKCLPTAVGL
jgi:chromatin remodeling complex protein RSC6